MNDKFLNTLIIADFINKYNLKAVQKTPRLNKIVIYFSLPQIESFSKKHLKNNDVNAQIKTFLFFFLFFAKIPKINFKKSNALLKNNYAFKINFASIKDINSFLLYLFIENSSNFKTTRNKNNKELKKHIIVNQIVESRGLQTIEYIFKSVFKDYKIQSLKFNISFIFSTKISQTDNFITNLFLFWLKELYKNK